MITCLLLLLGVALVRGQCATGSQCIVGASEPCCMNCTFQRLPCNDGNRCTKNDACDVAASIASAKSVCRGEAICPTNPDVCTAYRCDPATGNCLVGTLPDGSACGAAGTDPSTWDLCTFECRNGRCTAKQVLCDARPTASDDCNANGCNPQTGKCEQGPKPGKACNDNDACTTNDVCRQVGAQIVCRGESVTCADKRPIDCKQWLCAAGECVTSPAPCASSASNTLSSSTVLPVATSSGAEGTTQQTAAVTASTTVGVDVSTASSPMLAIVSMPLLAASALL
jgi:hypothetical protein